MLCIIHKQTFFLFIFAENKKVPVDNIDTFHSTCITTQKHSKAKQKVLSDSLLFRYKQYFFYLFLCTFKKDAYVCLRCTEL